MNNRYRNAPGIRGPSKASASTLCQKCLKRDIYECKSSAQDRPYVSRPSRTQQLLNPKLRPQLTTEVPKDVLNPKGVADDILAKREEERGRKRDLDEAGPLDGHMQTSKRARSASSHSVSSVSTISTSRSRSGSPRRRSEYTARGHSPSRSKSPRPSQARKRRYSDSPSEFSASSYSSGQRTRSRSREWAGDRNTRRRHRELSPEERGRARNASGDGSMRERTRSQSKNLRGSSHLKTRPIGDRNGRNPNPDNRHTRDYAPPQPRRERSLSPYSKRLALTQAMNLSG